MMGLGEKKSQKITHLFDYLHSETTKELRKLFTNIPMCSSQPSLYQLYYPNLTYEGIKLRVLSLPGHNLKTKINKLGCKYESF